MAFFSKVIKPVVEMQAISTLLGEGCILDGNLRAPSFVRIDGQINGDVFVEDGLILGETGLITGNIVTKEMVVFGTVNGNIQVGSLEIKATGRINGEISTQTLMVENGGVLSSGSFSMDKNETPAPKTISVQKVIAV
jgi:cytoskeletal protein CcmA (bactofilin family)